MCTDCKKVTYSVSGMYRFIPSELIPSNLSVLLSAQLGISEPKRHLMTISPPIVSDSL